MAQKYNIYINDKSLIIGNSLSLTTQVYQQIDAEGFDFEFFYQSLKNSPFSTFYLETFDVEKTFKGIKNSLRVIEAAGGLVKNEEEKFLFIKRNGKWDLPKGKLEPKETKKNAAVREVEEECGIQIKKLGKKLLKTYHVYEIKGKVVLKISHWYAMEAKGNQKLVPQAEEGITEVKWFPKKDFNIIRSNTYANILDVISDKQFSLKSTKIM
jgi:8-oxo-dGTP pyrophosphatase MutT (NUDIX family)